MNIRTEKAGYPSEEEILEQGFKICGSWEYNDMGQATYNFNDYSKDDKLFLSGGYWNYTIKDKDGNILFKGWWNTVEELKQTLTKLECKLLTNQTKNDNGKFTDGNKEGP